MSKCRILSSGKLTNHYPEELELEHFQFKKTSQKDRVLGILRLLQATRKMDAYIATCPGIEEAIVAFISKWILRQKTATIFFDTLLQRPDNMREKMVCGLKAVLFCGVDKFFSVHKDTTGYELYYKIPKSKFFYIPFKANNYNVAHKYESVDKGYVVACGASLRDYKTFIQAIKEVGVSAKIVLPNADVASFHNTPDFGDKLPSNLAVIRHNFDRDSWDRYISEARIVVIPIQERAIQPAGISVYLEAMALGKPVIITEGAATRGIITNEAEIVPPGDPHALSAAITKLWEDKEYREQLAHRGKKYALSLGNETRLVKDILLNAMALARIKGAIRAECQCL